MSQQPTFLRRFIASLPLLAVILLALTAAAPGLAQAVSDPRALEAVELYDAGKYAQARTLLEQLEADGNATGPLLYRLYFAKQRTGDREGAPNALLRAIEALEEEIAGADDYETPFYLVNAYNVARQSAKAREVAEKATGRFEKGELPKPASGLDTFRLAKMYADLNNEAMASEWYRKALDAFKGKESDFRAYVAWSRRYLGTAAFSKADYSGAAQEYNALSAAGIADQQDLDRLAVAHYRLGDLGQAKEAWDKAEALDKASNAANRARYSSKLATLAMEATLPPKSPEGGSWGSMSKQALEDLMQDQAAVVKDAAASVSAGNVSGDDAIAELQKKVDAAKGIFAKAGLEYSARNFPIRETAFQGGYAPLIFHPRQWQLSHAKAKAAKNQ